MLAGAALEKAISLQTPIPFEGTYARRVALSALFGIKSLPAHPAKTIQVQLPEFLRSSDRPYRFNPPGVRNLYLGEGEWTATAETKQHPGVKGFLHEPAAPDAIFHVSVKMGAILDLTSKEIMSALETTPDELMANWRVMSPVAPTQLLGQAAFESKHFEGLRYQSSPMKKSGEEGFCILLFRDRQRSSSTVEIFDPSKIWSESWISL